MKSRENKKFIKEWGCPYYCGIAVKKAKTGEKTIKCIYCFRDWESVLPGIFLWIPCISKFFPWFEVE